MSDVLGPEDPRFALPRLDLPASARRVALAAAVVLLAGVLAAVRGPGAAPVLLVASGSGGGGLVALRPGGARLPVALPAGLAPVRLLRLRDATVVLARPPMGLTGGRALLLRRPGSGVRDLGPADAVVPDARADRVWLVRDGSPKRLAAFDASGRARGARRVADPHDLLLVTPDGVLDDEVVEPGGSTPTLRSDAGRVLRRLPGPVQVLDVAGPRLLVLDGTCLDTCTVRTWDVRTCAGARCPGGAAPLDAGLLPLDGALSPDGRSVALAAQVLAPQGPGGVLLRGPLDGGEPRAARVAGRCTLRTCLVAWRGADVYAGLDLTAATLLRWRPGQSPEPVPARVPAVVDLAGLP